MRIFSWAIGVLGIVALSAAPLHAAGKPGTVAVMPFRDLSGGSKFVGEAIRETVTTDLKQIGSLRVVERGNLDKVLAEQGLQLQRDEPDLQTVVKLGKVLGASLIVIGAYQKLTPQVRLTARFVKVETSEIIGTAKVDGQSREFLKLQDRITAALLHSAGFAIHAKRVLDESANRPDLSSLKTLELYGQAVIADDDQTKRQYLAAAVAEDQNFSYAVKDLEALEKRIATYQAAARAIQEKELATIDEKLRANPEVTTRTELICRRFELLIALHRYHTVAREARAFLVALPAGSPISPKIEQIASQLMTANVFLRDYENTMRDGEMYMQRAPGSGNFATAKTWVEQAIAAKRRLQEGKQKAEEAVAKFDNHRRWDLCDIATMYDREQQHVEAMRLFNACFKVGTRKREEYLERLVLSAFLAGDWKEYRKVSAEWLAFDEKHAKAQLKVNEQSAPSDE